MGSACRIRKLSGHAIQFRRLGFAHFPGSIHFKHYLIAEPVADEIHPERYNQSDGHARFAAQYSPMPTSIRERVTIKTIVLQVFISNLR